MGAIKQGDRLFDETGAVCQVVAATGLMFGRPCNRVVFDDGVHVVADNDHVWRVSETPRRGEKSVLRTTMELERCLRSDPGYRCTVSAAGPLRAPQISEQELRAVEQSIRRPGPGLASVRGSIAQRRMVLRRLFAGLDGYWTPRGLCLPCPSLELLGGLVTLLRSLGYVPRVDTQRAAGGLVRWSRDPTERQRRILAIEPVESVPVRCIQVDSPSRLYLCSEGMVPTHNTFLMAEEIRRAARRAVQANISIENEIWYGAPTFLQAKRVMWNRLKRAFPGHWLDGRPNETGCVLRLRSGHVIRIVGLDAFEHLRGSGLWFFGGDEWADCRPEAWTEVLRPMLSTSRGHALFIGTPKGFDHFRDFYLRGQPGGDPSYRSFLFTTLEGGNVPPEEIVAAREQLDARTFRQEYGASFESYAGRVIYAFSRAENVKTSGYDASRPLHVGMDFNINPMSATVWQEDGEVTRQIGEIVLPTSNTDEIAAEITRRYGRPGFDPMIRTVDHITIYPDPAGAQRRSSAAGRTDIGILREAGFRVVAMAAHPTVRDRINVMNRQFLSAEGTKRAFVDPACVKSIESYERLTYRDGSMEPDKSHGYDHLVDASGYYLFGRTLRQSAAQAPISHFMER